MRRFYFIAAITVMMAVAHALYSAGVVVGSELHECASTAAD